ncbi:hypothetical protein D3C80_677680 [compost metagenome]
MGYAEQKAEAELEHLKLKVDQLETEVRRLTKNDGRHSTTTALHPISMNRSEIRDMFLLEILREKGLLADVDIEAVAARVTRHLAGDDVPWGASEKSARRSIEIVKHEIAGEYDWNPPEDED